MSAAPDFAAVARMPPIYRVSHRVVRAALAFYFQWRVLHPRRVPAVGPVILAANHASFADPPLLGCAVERTMNFLARDTLFDTPGFGWYLRQLNAVPVDRDGGGGAGLKAILDRLHAGGCILLFPEGTRSRDGCLQPAKSGIGLTVIKSEAPVVPVRVFGTFEAYGRGRLMPRPLPVTIKFGRPLPFAELRAEAKTCSKSRLKVIYQEVADEIMAAIGRLEPCEDVDQFP
jgi:1-acyl-sn-glycerol-3-phosphate acyltransferase